MYMNVNKCIYIYIHTNIHTYITLVHVQMNTLTYSFMRTHCMNAHIHTCRHKKTLIR